MWQYSSKISTSYSQTGSDSKYISVQMKLIFVDKKPFKNSLEHGSFALKERKYFEESY